MSTEQLSELLFEVYKSKKDELDFVLSVGKEFKLQLTEAEVIYHLCKKIDLK
jgi:hypothetical protein